MSQRSFKFKLTGITPLLMHQDSIDGADRIKKWRDNPKNKEYRVAGDDRSPAWTYLEYLYSDGKHVVLPQEVIMACIVNGANEIRMKGSVTWKRTVQAGMMCTKEYLKFTVNGKQIPVNSFSSRDEMDFDKHVAAAKKVDVALWPKRATISQAKHVRVRPRFENWEVEGEMDVFLPALTNDLISQFFDIAGRQKGICDWRPSAKKPGPFGMFSAELTF